MTKTANRARHALPLLPVLFILLIGVIVVQTFTSCSSDDDDGGGGSPGGGSSNTSETVTIGGRIWMRHNLNTNVPGSKCYGDLESNCAKYGRLYDWATAMALDASCNSVSCAGQIGNPHRGICPQGWHIPSDAEWTALENAVGGSSTAGTKLKSATGWNSGGNGTDDYGFSALPGGNGYSGGGFNSVGSYGFWWSATENYSSNAWGRYMYYYCSNVNRYDYNKSYLFSVRCLQD